MILDIFAHRARTSEARLAVELAQLEYSLPRLKQMWTHLSRIEGGSGMRGPGEKQLEVDRRLVEKKIRDLRRELAVIERRKERTVAARGTHRTVSLGGYTNAGKSTLMNRLTGADVLAQDKLFATLDTRTRRWQLPGWGPVLLSDTVGFIRDLPHNLALAFPRPITFIGRIPAAYRETIRLYDKAGGKKRIRTVPSVSVWTPMKDYPRKSS